MIFFFVLSYTFFFLNWTCFLSALFRIFFSLQWQYLFFHLIFLSIFLYIFILCFYSLVCLFSLYILFFLSSLFSPPEQCFFFSPSILFPVLFLPALTFLSPLLHFFVSFPLAYYTFDLYQFLEIHHLSMISLSLGVNPLKSFPHSSFINNSIRTHIAIGSPYRFRPFTHFLPAIMHALAVPQIVLSVGLAFMSKYFFLHRKLTILRVFFSSQQHFFFSFFHRRKEMHVKKIFMGLIWVFTVMNIFFFVPIRKYSYLACHYDFFPIPQILFTLMNFVTTSHVLSLCSSALRTIIEREKKKGEWEHERYKWMRGENNDGRFKWRKIE